MHSSVTAVEVRPGGTRRPVSITRDSSVEHGPKTTLAFTPGSEL